VAHDGQSTTTNPFTSTTSKKCPLSIAPHTAPHLWLATFLLPSFLLCRCAFFVFALRISTPARARSSPRAATLQACARSPLIAGGAAALLLACLRFSFSSGGGLARLGLCVLGLFSVVWCVRFSSGAWSIGGAKWGVDVQLEHMAASRTVLAFFFFFFCSFFGPFHWSLSELF
jgi:hypothetical protein